MAVEDLAPAAATGSLRDYLHQRHQQIARRKVDSFTLPVGGGWEDTLGIRYEFPEQGAEPLWEAQAKWLETGRLKLTLDGSLGVILAAAREIMGRQPGGEWERPLGDRPMTFGPELADMIGVDIEDVKAKSKLLCRHLFSPGAVSTGVFSGDLRLSEHATEVLGRFREGDASAGEEFSGE